MKDVAFGQYYPVKSFVHNLDPRMKIVFLIAYIVAIFLASNFYGMAVCFAALVFIVAFSRVPVKSVIRSIKGILFLLVFTAVLNIFFYNGDTVLSVGGVALQWKIFKITEEGIIYSVFLICRLFLLVMGSSVLTLTTTPVALTDGLESLLFVFKLIKLPIHELALIMSIALRFIPTLMDETERIMNAQKARGADFETGSVFHRAKAVVPVLIPLLISSFRRAEELGDAMDARCYSGSKTRTKYKKLVFTWRDLLAFLFVAAIIAGVVLFKIYFNAVV